MRESAHGLLLQSLLLEQHKADPTHLGTSSWVLLVMLLSSQKSSLYQTQYMNSRPKARAQPHSYQIEAWPTATASSRSEIR